ncbi:hypothetical protein Pmani_027653 [Petrolisthes manimaculis]|uniref:Uncharacterized protein n=1 Tax=Petrolisthes manimaculis TaxID=1843537 RepID=A0AAE1P2I6_9EUCA|nr:hypothetical protein Pmani_027653 [Petrolisthes manimaculis]
MIDLTGESVSWPAGNESWRKLCYEPHQSTNHSSDEEDETPGLGCADLVKVGSQRVFSSCLYTRSELADLQK